MSPVVVVLDTGYSYKINVCMYVAYCPDMYIAWTYIPDSISARLIFRIPTGWSVQTTFFIFFFFLWQ